MLTESDYCLLFYNHPSDDEYQYPCNTPEWISVIINDYFGGANRVTHKLRQGIIHINPAMTYQQKYLNEVYHIYLEKMPVELSPFDLYIAVSKALGCTLPVNQISEKLVNRQESGYADKVLNDSLYKWMGFSLEKRKSSMR
ncbi:hypothetical protein ACTL6P_14160 [Endozoicomonas acroporae]|uniref:hypothetical protein n=1 Tax=Endozoicomonas acroporae TaxID=1701104 RepID=UPI000C794053|nr:hypothetical protein [Endozoicomonas acroporae]